MEDSSAEVRREIRSVFGQDLQLPTLPDDLDRIVVAGDRQPGLWGSAAARHVATERGSGLYLVEGDCSEFLAEAPEGYVVIGLWGYGLFSHAFYYCWSDPGAKLFLRLPYGGGHGVEEAGERVVAFFESFTPFLHTIRPLIESIELVISMGSLRLRIVSKSGETVEDRDFWEHSGAGYWSGLLNRLGSSPSSSDRDLEERK